MSENAKAVVRRFVEEIQDKHRLELVDELFEPGFIDHFGAGGMSPLEGATPADVFKRFYSGMLRAFPDVRVQIDDQFAEGERVVTRKTFRGTHTGEFFGNAPSGKHVELEVIDIFRVRNGKLAEHWGHVDVLSILTQIGAKPPGP